MLNVLTYARRIQTEYVITGYKTSGSVAADRRDRKQAQPPKDEYQQLLIENLVAANQEATRNFHTLLKTIGPANETSSIATVSTRFIYW